MVGSDGIKENRITYGDVEILIVTGDEFATKSEHRVRLVLLSANQIVIL